MSFYLHLWISVSNVIFALQFELILNSYKYHISILQNIDIHIEVILRLEIMVKKSFDIDRYT